MDLEVVWWAQGLWVDIMRNKYLRTKDLLVDSQCNGSQFWNAIQKVKAVFFLGEKQQLRCGRSTRLWLDWWEGPAILKDRFPTIFALLSNLSVPLRGRPSRGSGAFRWGKPLGVGSCWNGEACCVRLGSASYLMGTGTFRKILSELCLGSLEGLGPSKDQGVPMAIG